MIFENYNKYGHSKWVIERKSDNSKIGHTGLVITTVDSVSDVELGYFLDPSAWGQGYAVEAADSALKLAFQKYGYKKVISAINPDNYPSIKVATRLGMTKEKTGMAKVGPVSWWADIYSITC